MDFSTASPSESGWYWMQDITTFSEPEIVYVRPISLSQESELGFIRTGSTKITALSSVAIAGLKQWQPVKRFE